MRPRTSPSGRGNCQGFEEWGEVFGDDVMAADVARWDPHARERASFTIGNAHSVVGDPCAVAASEHGLHRLTDIFLDCIVENVQDRRRSGDHEGAAARARVLRREDPNAGNGWWPPALKVRRSCGSTQAQCRAAELSAALQTRRHLPLSRHEAYRVLAKGSYVSQATLACSSS